MKYLLSFIFLLVSSQFIFAQSIGNKYSTYVKTIAEKGDVNIKDVLCSSKYGVYLFQSNKGEKSIILVNNEGDRVANVVVEEADAPKKEPRSFKDAYVLDESLYVVNSAFVQSEKKNYLIIDKYDAATLESQGNILRLEENYPGKKVMYWYGIGALRANGEMSELGTAISPNKQYLASYTSEYTKRGKDKERVKVVVNDGEGNKVWELDKTLSKESKLITLMDMRVSDSGYVYIMADVVSKDSDVVKRKILSFKENGKLYKELSLPRELNEMEGTAWDLLDNGFFQIYGYTKTKGGAVSGYEVLVFDPYEKKIVERNGGNFTPELVKMYLTDKSSKKKDKQAKKEGEYGLNNLVARQLVKLEDGGAYLVGEQYAVVTTTYSSGPGRTSTRVSYYYGDIVVVRINSLGEMVWEAKIPKAQQAGLVTYFSYHLSLCNEDLNFFFNDKPSNVLVTEQKKLDTYTGLMDVAQTHIFNVSSTGQVTEYAVPRYEQGNARFKVRNTVELPNCGTFILEEINGEYRGRFIFQE